MKNIFKRLFGKKEKPKDKSHIPEDFTLEERKISPLLTPEDKSVPLEENVMDIVQPEEPIAPTLERQDEIIEEKKPARKVNLSKPVVDLMNEMSEGEKYFKENIEKINEKDISLRGVAMKEVEKTTNELNELKKKKPKKQAKKKDNRNPDDDKLSWPSSNNFTL